MHLNCIDTNIFEFKISFSFSQEISIRIFYLKHLFCNAVCRWQMPQEGTASFAPAGTKNEIYVNDKKTIMH